MAKPYFFSSLREAIADTIRDGTTLPLEGFTHLIPFAAGHEIIRQQRHNLTLVRMTPDLIYDQMIGMDVQRYRVLLGWKSKRGTFRARVDDAPRPET